MPIVRTIPRCSVLLQARHNRGFLRRSSVRGRDPESVTRAWVDPAAGTGSNPWYPWEPAAQRNAATLVMPEERVELSRGCPRGILSPLRLPFRHSGAHLGLRWCDPLRIPLLGEHAFREVQPLLDIGEPSLHVLERVETRLHVFAAAHPLLQVFDRLRQVAPGRPGPAGPISRSDPPRERFGDRDGQHDEPDADGPIGDTEHAPPPVSP